MIQVSKNPATYKMKFYELEDCNDFSFIGLEDDSRYRTIENCSVMEHGARWIKFFDEDDPNEEVISYSQFSFAFNADIIYYPNPPIYEKEYLHQYTNKQMKKIREHLINWNDHDYSDYKFDIISVYEDGNLYVHLEEHEDYIQFEFPVWFSANARIKDKRIYAGIVETSFFYEVL